MNWRKLTVMTPLFWKQFFIIWVFINAGACLFAVIATIITALK